MYMYIMLLVIIFLSPFLVIIFLSPFLACNPLSPPAAHIGVGISGLEGQQAVLSSDFSFGQFRYTHTHTHTHMHTNLLYMSCTWSAAKDMLYYSLHIHACNSDFHFLTYVNLTSKICFSYNELTWYIIL